MSIYFIRMIRSTPSRSLGASLVVLLAALLGVLFAETWAPQATLELRPLSLPLHSSAKHAAVDAAAAAAELDALASIVLTSAGVCHFYPRCLLYSCCSAALLAATQSSFAARASAAPRASLSAPLAARMRGHPLVGLTITKESLARGLAALTPTPPSAFAALRTRREFRVLYLAQGDDHRAALPQWYLRNMKDLLYLSFRNVTADFLFPDSNFGEGRLALYLAGRLLEIQQGWLYDYFIFLDDDVSAVTPEPLASFLFELDLLQWEPAIGGPCFPLRPPDPRTSVASSAHMDFLNMAYHREILELIHPWVLDFDADCIWASQLLQTYEFDLVARNHALFSRDFCVGNSKHREYSKNCFLDGGGPPHSGFPAVHADVMERMGKQRAHCLPKTGILSVDNFQQYIRAGAPRPRLSSYVLSPSSSFDDGCAGRPTDFADPGCCAFEAFSPRVGGSPHHNRVVTERSGGSRGTYSFVWGAARWDFDGLDTLAALGFAETDVILVDAAEISALAPLDMRSTHSQISGLPCASRISVVGIDALQLIVSESGVSYLPSEREAIAALADASSSAAALSITLPIWRTRYLALSAAARAAIAEAQKDL